jgi:hypothetical protein
VVSERHGRTQYVVKQAVDLVEESVEPLAILERPQMNGVRRLLILAEVTASTPRLAKGPGKSPNGTYLYPASEANSPTRQGVNGKYGEYESDPLAETLLANSPSPVRGGEYGELADGVAQTLDQDEELGWR